MKVLIIEDETAASENLIAMLKEIDNDIEVLQVLESVQQTVRWLGTNPDPDLIFMDIHLSDDSAFAIFNQIEVNVPIVFTTAYDQYALDAFRVNSIDYLLKPIKAKAVRRAIEKFHKINMLDLADYLGRMGLLASESRWTQRLLVPHKDMLVPVNVENISYIYSTDKNTTVCLKSGEQLNCHKSLESLLTNLDPQKFFRANKQFAVNRDSVRNITVWYDSRLLITLDNTTPERLFISKNRAAEFKQWMMSS